MDTLHKTLEKTLDELPYNLLASVVRKKIEAHGIKLSQRELRLLRSHLRKGNLGTFTVQRKSHKHKQVTINIDERETQELVGRLQKFFSDDFPPLIQTLVAKFSEPIYVSLKRRWAAESRFQRNEISGFQRRLERRWRSPLVKLRMLVTIAREFGSNINQALRMQQDGTRTDLVEVLSRSHARACQITEEIICLLSAGFADGAMARWRTLHEIAVVALFIQSHGNQLAERYVAHQVVESYRAAVEYRRWQEKLGYDPISDETLAEIKVSFDAAVARFGRSFETPYGWAADELNNPKPTFADIERAAGADHLRTFYRMASHNVHANPKGVFFKLGLMAETPVLLSGPSNAGLADPGHSAAISLVQVSTAIGLLRPTFDNLVASKIMVLLQDEIGDAFIAAHRKLEQDEQRVRDVFPT